MPKPAYHRILLKLSGEALMGRQAYGIDEDILAGLSEEIREVTEMGVQVALVVGGGNIFRGIGTGRSLGIDRASADYMGMLATVINAIALQEVLEQQRGGHPGALRHRDAGDRRAVHPAARHAPPREGAGGDLRGGDGEPLLHHRHRRGPARDGDQRRRHPQGDQGRRRVRPRPHDSTGKRRSSPASPTSTS